MPPPALSQQQQLPLMTLLHGLLSLLVLSGRCCCAAWSGPSVRTAHRGGGVPRLEINGEDSAALWLALEPPRCALFAITCTPAQERESWAPFDFQIAQARKNGLRIVDLHLPEWQFSDAKPLVNDSWTAQMIQHALVDEQVVLNLRLYLSIAGMPPMQYTSLTGQSITNVSDLQVTTTL